MEPISFDIYFKVVGSSGVVGLITQLLTIYKLQLEVSDINKKIFDTKPSVKIDGNDNSILKKSTKDIPRSATILRNLFIVSIITVLIYSVTSNINYLFDTSWYKYIVCSISYISIITIPGFILFHLNKMLTIYFLIKLIDNKYLNNGNNISQK